MGCRCSGSLEHDSAQVNANAGPLDEDTEWTVAPC